MSIIDNYTSLNQRLRELTGPSWYPHAQSSIDFLTRQGSTKTYFSWKPISERARDLILKHFGENQKAIDVIVNNTDDGWLIDVSFAHDTESFVKVWTAYPSQLITDKYAQTIINDNYIIRSENV